MNTPDLLQLARDSGLRQALHGLTATDARELLRRFVAALDAARTPSDDATAEWNAVRDEARALAGPSQPIGKLLLAVDSFGSACEARALRRRAAA